MTHGGTTNSMQLSAVGSFCTAGNLKNNEAKGGRAKIFLSCISEKKIVIVIGILRNFERTINTDSTGEGSNLEVRYDPIAETVSFGKFSWA